MGEVAIGTTMLGVLTWAGNLASWWLEWTQQAGRRALAVSAPAW